MASNTYAVVDKVTGVVENRIVAGRNFSIEGKRLVADSGGKAQIGGAYRGGKFTTPNEERPFEEVRAEAEASIDQAAASLRASLAPEQTLGTLWADKAAEAEQVLALDAKPAKGDFPLLEASLGIDGDSVDAIAEKVLDRRRKWLRKIAAIEAVRLRAKAGIREAKDHKALAKLLDKIAFPPQE
jgi:hypothetical protein